MDHINNIYLAEISSLNFPSFSNQYQKKAEEVLKLTPSKNLEDYINILTPLLNPASLVSKNNTINTPITHKLRNEHETYFSIKRINCNNADLLLENLLNSFLLMLEDCLMQGHSLPHFYFTNILFTIHNFVKLILGKPGESLFNKDCFISILERKEIPNPYNRWIKGHYLFFSIIQSLILIHNMMIKEVSKSQLKNKQYLYTAGNLFYISISAFQYGTHYSASDYQERVRPTMGPPHFSPGFSDLNSLDHRALLATIKTVKTLDLFDHVTPQEYTYYITALSTLYNHHSLVCSRAVGHSSSLLQASQSNKTPQSKSAAETIRTVYKKRTLKLASKKGFVL